MGSHELAFVGLAGSGLGTALGVPMVWPKARRTMDVRLLGLALLLTSAIAALISARLAGLVAASTEVEHTINVLGLCAFPLLVLYTRYATAALVTRSSLAWLALPALVYLALVATRAALGLDSRVPFAWLLPAVLGFTAAGVATLWRRGEAGQSTIVPARWVVAFVVTLNAAQIVRMAFAHVPIVRAVVPLVMSTAFLAATVFLVRRALGVGASSETASPPSYERSGLESSAARDLLNRIDQAMSEDRLFARTDLTLAHLAAAVGATPHQVSEVLNRYDRQSFYDLVNRRRVDEVKAQLLDPESDRFTIEGIGESAGFGSRSALYAAFRRFEGMTPTAFRASRRAGGALAFIGAVLWPLVTGPIAQSTLPSTPLAMRDFVLRFDPAGTFSLSGAGWPSMAGTWRLDGTRLTLQLQSPPQGCGDPGRYTVARAGRALEFAVESDSCQPRRMIVDRSRWLPAGIADPIPERRLVRTTGVSGALPPAASSTGAWPSFRGPEASGVADGQELPDRWDPATGEHILWRTPIPGLAHSSPVVWGDLVFVTTAISGRGTATFKPGLYGDGDASDDRSLHRWVLYAIDKRTGQVRWERTAAEGEPRNKRHIKSSYASASPATDGRIVVAWFGSQGIHAYDVTGRHRWSVDLGRVDMGAYDIPAFEWGPASSPIIWNDLVIVQCDTQADSFLLALNAATGETVWRTPRKELPSWGTPTVVATPAGPELITNASNLVRAYDPRTGRELWHLGGSSKITAPTPISAGGLHIVASGRAPERPVFAIRAGARGDLTLPSGETASTNVVWSKTGRGSYMPTPLAYRGQLYVLANNGVFDAYDLATGREVYRQRLPQIGSGFSASPVAADGKIYLSSEDGEVLVIAAGPTFSLLATNTMPETLMATPALSSGVMYVRGASSLFAIGRR